MKLNDLNSHGLEHLSTKDLDILYREYVRALNKPIDELNGYTLSEIFAENYASEVVHNMAKEIKHGQ